ncbi:MAG: hypothetical protein U9R42_11425 [Bacteroidota bacterium]|nr:hypothetical protein [Bacteroidota bacterium]
MLINLSNHPQNKWSSKQKEIALKKFNNIIDLSFPAINPEFSKKDVRDIAENYFEKIIEIFNKTTDEKKLNAVHIQGEFTFVFQLVSLLKNNNIKCIASTSKRKVTEVKNGKKIAEFEFVKFREY